MKDKSEALKKDNLVSIKDAYINVEEKVLDPDKLVFLLRLVGVF